MAIVAYLISFAVVFDTFSLDLYSTLYNILLSLPLFGLVLMITRRFHIAVLVTTIVDFIIFYVDQYVFSSRLTHIRFSDFKLIDQALRVADRYPLIWNLEITRRLFLAILVCAFLFLIVYYYKLEYSWKTAFFTGLGTFCLSFAIVVAGAIPSDTESYDFSTDAEERGLLYSWYCQLKEDRLTEPDGYSKAAAEIILDGFDKTESTADVNVLVIMNESLADYSLIGKPRFDDPLPFIHKLVDSGEAFEGKLVVNVFGGGTATTEYEFLTGHTMAFLPEGASPYLQYVNGRTENLTSELGGQGYRNIAIHPYYSEEWNRSQVYKFFGFDQFISGMDFGDELVSNGRSATSRVPDNQMSFGEGPLYIRGLISDQTDYEKVLESIEEKSFIFNVTMQNHGGYGYDGSDFSSKRYVTEKNRTDWTGERRLTGMLYNISAKTVEEEIDSANQYLTCSNLSDKAFEYLIKELKKSDKKTVVLMFGDHQPGVMISEHYLDLYKNVDMDYTVPYILWANYDLEFDAPETTSPNYLSAILKKNAGLCLTPWDQFRLEMMEQYPVMTAYYILDRNGKNVGKDALKDYEIVQYLRMFDR